MDTFADSCVPAHAGSVIWRRKVKGADVFLLPAVARELCVSQRAWLKIEPARAIYCVAYKLPGDHEPIYAGRTPTPADYEAARADPVGVAVDLIRADRGLRAA